MEAASEAITPGHPDARAAAQIGELELTATAGTATAPRTIALPRARVRLRSSRLSATARQELLWICVVYLSARVVLLVTAYVMSRLGQHPLQNLLSNWDGLWYRDVANNGYPQQVSHAQTNLGFFPLYPMTIWVVEHPFELFGHGQIWASTYAGVTISGIGGLISTVFVHRLADGWWGRAAARRATVLYTFFCGGVVFSMVYSEGLLLPLATICVWALERRKWILAGAMAGCGTAVQPVGLVLGLVCAVVALQQLWQHGPRSREFGMSLLAAVMSSFGAVAFCIFEWVWTGNPFATYVAQHYGWGEKTDGLAVIHMVTRAAKAFDPSHFNHPEVNFNLVVGTIGAVLMLYELVLLVIYRRSLSLPAIVWTLAITFMAMTSEYVPPNPRMLITAFPMLMLLARQIQGKWFAVLMWVNGVLFIGLSILTFYEHVLRP